MAGTTPVAQYGKLDNTTQTFSAYKAGIDANSVASLRIVGRFAPHAQTSPNMTIMLDAGSIFNGTTLTEVAAQSTSTITAPVLHPRIDRVVIDNTTGAIAVVAGTEAVTPTVPAIPTGKSPVAQVLLQTSTTAITNASITDERNFGGMTSGGIGAQSSLSSATTCNIGTITSHNVLITGSTTITSFGTGAMTLSPIYLLEFSGAATLTYNATSMILPGAANIVTATGDTAVAEYLGSGNWKIRSYSRATGKPLFSTAPTFQYLTSVGTGSYTSPPGCTSIFVREVGPGGGGAGFGSGTAGGSGSSASFNGIAVAGGSPGVTTVPGAGGTGGSGAAAYRQLGASGSLVFGSSAVGGHSRLGNGGGGGSGSGSDQPAGPGGGGGGGASGGGGSASAASGGAGEYAEFTLPAGTYPFTITAGGAAGTGAITNGGPGGDAQIIVQENYN